MNIESTVGSLQKLNASLPESHQLEKLSFVVNPIETEHHLHLDQCEKIDNDSNIYPISGVFAAQGKRQQMEDTHVLIDCLKCNYENVLEHYDRHLSFYAVYDGHGGKRASHMCAQILHDSLVQSSEFIGMNIRQAIEDAYLFTDRVILQKSKEEKWLDGSTGVTLLLAGNILFSANVGDSEAVLGRRYDDDPVDLGYDALLLTTKHVPANPAETTRIQKAGGFVVNNRVKGNLAVSRAFGDLDYKDIPMVIPAPFILETELTDADEFIIIACDGLWDVMTYNEAVEYVADRRKNNISPKDVSEELVNNAIEKRGSTDNVSVIVVYLKPLRA